MPAMASSNGDSAAESWKLVSYIRSLRPLTSGEKTTEASTSTSAHYVGSQTCQRCHQDIYDRWKKTPMANVVRDPREHPDAIIPDLSTNTVARFTKDQVAFVYGSKWKQRYFTKIGDDYYPLPAQWDIGNKTWRPYHVPDTGADWWTAYYPSDNMQRPTGATCDGCHSVNYDIHTKQVAEWNVGCERCHGPGSEHATHPSRANILNPSQMDTYRRERHLYRLPFPGTTSLSADRREGLRLACWLPRRSPPGRLLEARRSHTGADDLHSFCGRNRSQKQDAGQ